jgi:hypothetical protein
MFVGFDTVTYFEQLMGETYSSYKRHSFEELSSLINEYKYVSKLILLEFIKKKTAESRLKSSTIIDVDPENVSVLPFDGPE